MAAQQSRPARAARARRVRGGGLTAAHHRARRAAPPRQPGGPGARPPACRPAARRVWAGPRHDGAGAARHEGATHTAAQRRELVRPPARGPQRRAPAQTAVPAADPGGGRAGADARRRGRALAPQGAVARARQAGRPPLSGGGWPAGTHDPGGRAGRAHHALDRRRLPRRPRGPGGGPGSAAGGVCASVRRGDRAAE